LKNFIGLLTVSIVYLQSHAALASTIANDSASVSLGLGTLGAGGTIGIHPLSSPFGVRIGANLLHFQINFTSSGTRDEAQANLQNETLLADYYPWRKNFRITAGIVFNQNSAAFASTPELTGALQKFLARSHDQGEIGNVHGPISFNPVAPYLGFGWTCKLIGHWDLSADIGAMYQGNGRITLVPTGLIASTARLRAGVLANAQRADRIIDKVSVYPVIGLQIEYRF